jgi:hypothetical protein
MRGDDVSSGCILPLAQSLITGVIVGFLAYSAGLWAGWLNTQYMALTAGIAGAATIWLTSLRRWQRAAFPELLLPTLPANDDPEPEYYEPVGVRVEMASEDSRQLKFIDLPASIDQLVTLAQGLLTGGATLSESQWTGSGGIFTRAEFAALRSEMIRRGLATWNSPGTPARGVSLTPPGRAAMRHFASMAGASPTLSRRGMH